MDKSIYDLKRGFSVNYIGEVGVDCGGLLR